MIGRPHLLPARSYPFTIELFDVDTGERVWHRTLLRPVPGFYDMAYIPGFAPRRIMVVIGYATGETTFTEPDGAEHSFWA